MTKFDNEGGVVRRVGGRQTVDEVYRRSTTPTSFDLRSHLRRRRFSNDPSSFVRVFSFTEERRTGVRGSRGITFLDGLGRLDPCTLNVSSSGSSRLDCSPLDLGSDLSVTCRVAGREERNEPFENGDEVRNRVHSKEGPSRETWSTG